MKKKPQIFPFCELHVFLLCLKGMYFNNVVLQFIFGKYKNLGHNLFYVHAHARVFMVDVRECVEERCERMENNFFNIKFKASQKVQIYHTRLAIKMTIITFKRHFAM